MEVARQFDVIGGYELSVVKWADRFDNIFAAVRTVTGVGLLAVSNGWLGWGPDVTEARWLVQVRECDQGDNEVRTVHTAFTHFGARRAARKVRAVLASGDEQAIRALPDLIY